MTLTDRDDVDASTRQQLLANFALPVFSAGPPMQGLPPPSSAASNFSQQEVMGSKTTYTHARGHIVYRINTINYMFDLRFQAQEQAELTAQAAMVMKNMSKAHGQWDKSVRAWQSLLHKSSTNALTSGTKPELDLQGQIEAGIALDKMIMDLEAKIKASGDMMSLTEVKEAKQLCEQLFAVKQAGTVSSNRLQSWLE